MDKKRRKLCLERNDGQEAEIAALKQKLLHMEAELKMNKAEKEDLVQRVTSLEQDFAKKEAQLNLSEEKCRTLQERLDLAEQKLALFSQKAETVAEECLAQAKKMSTPKTKSPPFNLQLVYDNEVAISLERLIDSVVMEVAAHRSALQPQQANESNYEALNINSLPEEILVKVFGYLSQNKLGQIARVCRRWSVLTKRPILWKKVNVHFSPSHKSSTAVVEHFINLLPPCVTHLSLNFIDSWTWIERFNFEEISMKLEEKCPDLEVLILKKVTLTDNLPSVIDLCSMYLHKVKILAFHICEFSKCTRNDKCDGISKIEVLDLKFCILGSPNKPSFSKLSYLKRLCLNGTCKIDSWLYDDISFINQLHILDLGYRYISSRTFQAIQNHGHILNELYLCGTYLDQIDLSFNNSVCSHLKTICLGSCSRVTCEGVISLIQSCPSLLNVYVDENVAESYAAHPFIVANRCKAGIVKSIHSNHMHNYLLKQ